MSRFLALLEYSTRILAALSLVTMVVFCSSWSAIAADQVHYLPLVLKNYPPSSGKFCVDPPPEGPAVITCISKDSGPPGTVLTIEGRGFGYCYQNCAEWDSVSFSGGGFAKHGLILSYEDEKIVVQVPGPPFGECSWDRQCPASIAVHIPTMYAPHYDPLYFTNHVPFAITGLQADPPANPSFPLTDTNASVGDVIEIYAYGLSTVAANNLVSFNGATAVALTYTKIDPWPHWGKITVRIPAGATSGPLKVRRLDGIDQWSGESSPFIVVAPNVPALTPGLEGGGLLNPCTYPDPQNTCFDKSRNWMLMESWVLNGSGFSKLRHPSGVSGALPLEITTARTSLTVDAYVQSDSLLVMPGNYLADQVNFQGILQDLQVGDSITVRVKGMELTNRQIRASAPLPLTYARKPASQSDKLLILPALPQAMDISQGDHLCVYAEYSYNKPGPQHSLQAPGIWSGSLTFSDGRLTAKCFEMAQAGTFTLSDQTTGKSTQIRVLAEGAYDNVSVSSSTLAQTGVTLAFGGGRLVIPPGALPLHDGSGAYSLSAFHRASTANFNDYLRTDGGHQFGVHFDPKPPRLDKPITISLPYGGNPPLSSLRFGFYDQQSQAYFAVEPDFDPAPAKRLGITVPASSSGLADNPLLNDSWSSWWDEIGYFATDTLEVVAAMANSGQTAILQPPSPLFRVEYVTEVGNPNYCTEAYARSVRDTMEAAHALFVGTDQWPWGGTGPRHVTIAKYANPGSTNKGVTTPFFGGVVGTTIDNGLRLGKGESLEVTAAHELGHHLQRSYKIWPIPNPYVAWIDEATATWVAFVALNGQFSNQSIQDNFMKEKNGYTFTQFPDGFIQDGYFWPYDEATAYSAASFIIWLVANNPRGRLVVRDLYLELLFRDNEWPISAYPVWEKITGSPIEDIIRDFSRAYWAQNYEPVHRITLPWSYQDFSEWVFELNDQRPPLSSKGYALQVAASWKPTITGRGAAIRAYGLGTGQFVDVYGTTVIKDSAASTGTQTHLGTLTWNHPSLAVGNIDTYPWYRLISVNSSRTETSNLSIEVVFPHILRLMPDSGSHSGNYTSSIAGYGFGGTAGKVMFGSQELTVANGGITDWRNSNINLNVPSVPSGQQVTVRVITAENVASDAATFTYN